MHDVDESQKKPGTKPKKATEKSTHCMMPPTRSSKMLLEVRVMETLRVAEGGSEGGRYSGQLYNYEAYTFLCVYYF